MKNLTLREWAAADRGRSTWLAQRLGVAQPAISQWCSATKQVPASQCPLIERHTGVLCETLRPDVDWTVLLKRGALEAMQSQERYQAARQATTSPPKRPAKPRNRPAKAKS